MAFRSGLERQYEAGRKNLLLMLILTAANAALALLDSSWSFLFTAMFPYVAALQAGQWLGLAADLVLCCLLPLLCFFFCWVMSRGGNVPWLAGAFVLFLLDSGYLVYFLFRYGFDVSFLLNILYHVLVLVSLGSGCLAGFALLRGDFREQAQMYDAADPQGAAPLPPQGGAQPAQPAAQAAQQPGDGELFAYDKLFAKQNGAARAWQYFAVLAGGIGGMAAVVLLPLPGAVLLALAALWLAGVVFAAIRLEPFLQAANTSYAAAGGGLNCYRSGFFAMSERYADPVLLEQRRDRFVLDVQTVYGRRRKITVPNGYPGLQQYFEKIGIL